MMEKKPKKNLMEKFRGVIKQFGKDPQTNKQNKEANKQKNHSHNINKKTQPKHPPKNKKKGAGGENTLI